MFYSSESIRLQYGIYIYSSNASWWLASQVGLYTYLCDWSWQAVRKGVPSMPYINKHCWDVSRVKLNNSTLHAALSSSLSPLYLTFWMKTLQSDELLYMQSLASTQGNQYTVRASVITLMQCAYHRMIFKNFFTLCSDADFLSVTVISIDCLAFVVYAALSV